MGEAQEWARRDHRHKPIQYCHQKSHALNLIEEILFKILSIRSQQHSFELDQNSRLNQITLITGINGTGKSRLLADLIKVFVLQHLRPEGTPVSENSMFIDYNRPPSKVVAQTFSPFSKFPAPPRDDIKRSPLTSDYDKSDVFGGTPDYYLPIGFHKRSGLYSSGIVRKVIEDSLIALTHRRGIKGKPLASALKHLGYKPIIKVRYRTLGTNLLKLDQVNFSAALSKEIDEKIGSSSRFGVGGNYALLRKAVEFSGKEKILMDLLEAANVLRELLINNNKSHNIDLALELDNVDKSKMNVLRAALLLRRAGFLRLLDLRLELDDSLEEYQRNREFYQSHQTKNYGIITDGEVDVDDLSSGQLQIIGTVFSLATMLENDCLVVIDEPELSLHPKWQLEWLTLLESAMQDYSGCHVFIATHSPLITTTAHEAGIQIVSVNPQAEDTDSTQSLSKNASIEETLTEVFGTPVPNSSYLSAVLFDAVSLANSSRRKKKEAVAKLEKLEKVYANEKAVLLLIKDAKELLNEKPNA